MVYPSGIIQVLHKAHEGASQMQLDEASEEDDIMTYVESLDQTEDYKDICRQDCDFLREVCATDVEFSLT